MSDNLKKRLVKALKDLLYCISETRGRSAYVAVNNARAVVDEAEAETDETIDFMALPGIITAYYPFDALLRANGVTSADEKMAIAQVAVHAISKHLPTIDVNKLGRWAIFINAQRRLKEQPRKNGRWIKTSDILAMIGKEEL